MCSSINRNRKCLSLQNEILQSEAFRTNIEAYCLYNWFEEAIKERRHQFCECVSITKGEILRASKEKLFVSLRISHGHPDIQKCQPWWTRKTGINPPTCTTQKYTILPLSLARLCIIWTSNELSRKVCSRINDRNLAWIVEIRFRSVYKAMVCSQSFQFANHSTKVLTWSRNSVWCAGFMSLAKDKPWNRRKISLIVAHKHGLKQARADIRKCLKHTYMKANWGRRKPSPIFLSIHVQPRSEHVRSCLVQGLYSSIIHRSCVSTFEWIARFVQSARICIRLRSKRTFQHNQTPATQNKTTLRCFSPSPLEGDSKYCFFFSTLIKRQNRN